MDENRYQHMITGKACSPSDHDCKDNDPHGPDLTACINRVRRLSDCIEIANLINSELSIGKLLSNVMTATREAFAADAVSLLLKDEETGDLIFYIALGDVADEIKEIYRLKKGQGIAGLVAETGLPLNIKDAYKHPSFSSSHDKITNYRTRAMLCVPLKLQKKVIGVIQVINKLVPPFYFSSEELEMLITISTSAAVAIDTAKMHTMILQRETLERDLKLAREVQESFLPKELPILATHRFAALNQPAMKIGGDFYNVFKLPGNRLGIVLGDVSGKGISASLFMARLSSDLQYYTFIHPDPEELLNRINRELCGRTKRGMFVTLVYMLLDPETRTIKLANAGHVSPVYSCREDVHLLGQDNKKGPPLGIVPTAQYKSETFILEKDSQVTLYTDGVIDAKNNEGHLFGIEGLIRTIRNSRNAGPEDMIRAITDQVDRFAMGEPRTDDLTLLVMNTI